MYTCLSLNAETAILQSRQYRAITCLLGLLEAVNGTCAHYALNNWPVHTGLTVFVCLFPFPHSGRLHTYFAPWLLFASIPPTRYSHFPFRNSAILQRKLLFLFSLPTLRSSSTPLLPLSSSRISPFLPRSFTPAILSFSSSPPRPPSPRR